MNNDDTNPQPTKPQTPPASAFGSDRKVFDVMRPGKAPASPTSRPVVIGHRPQAHDDQLVPSADSRYASENPLDEKRDLLTHKGGVDFASPSVADEYPDDPPGDAKPTNDAEPKEQEPTDTDAPVDPSASYASAAPEPKQGEDKGTAEAEDSASEEVPTEQPAPSSDPNAPETPETTPDEPNGTTPEGKPTESVAGASSEASGSSVWPEQSATPAAPEPMAPEAEKAPKPNANADVDELPQLGPDDVVAATGAPVIDHSFVVHHKTRTKWWEWLLIIILILILAAATLNLLLDAQVIKTNLNIPHTHLIN